MACVILALMDKETAFQLAVDYFMSQVPDAATWSMEGPVNGSNVPNPVFVFSPRTGKSGGRVHVTVNEETAECTMTWPSE